MLPSCHHKCWGITASVSGIDFQSTVDSSARIPVRGSGDPHSHGGSQFMIQPHEVQEVWVTELINLLNMVPMNGFKMRTELMALEKCQQCPEFLSLCFLPDSWWAYNTSLSGAKSRNLCGSARAKASQKYISNY